MRVVERWRSVDGSDRFAIELSVASGSSAHLASSLQAPGLGSSGASFLLLSLETREPGWIARSIAAVERTSLPVHVCLAVRPSDLQTFRRGPPSDRVGLVLEAADTSVPFAALADERIQAVRFSSSCSAAASESLRAARVFEAMLRLARDLGLATMGSSAAGRDQRMSDEGLFDYVSEARLPVATVRAPSPPDFELSR